MELMCQTALYNTERKNVFNSSSPLTNLTVNDMHRNPNLVLLLLNHSEDLQISQEDAHLCQNRMPRMTHRDTVAQAHWEIPRPLRVLLDPNSCSSWNPVTSHHHIPSWISLYLSLVCRFVALAYETQLYRAALYDCAWLWDGTQYFQGQNVTGEEKEEPGCPLYDHQLQENYFSLIIGSNFCLGRSLNFLFSGLHL